MEETITLARTKNCGIVEINGLSLMKGPREALNALRAVLYRGVTWPMLPDHSGDQKGMRYPFVVFTAAFKEGVDRSKNYGHRFATFITEHDLGGVVTTDPQLNWTQNLIQIWVWTPNYPNLWALLDPAPELVVPKGTNNASTEAARYP